MSPDERYLIGEDFGPRELGVGDDFDAIVGRISGKDAPALPNCVGGGTCFEKVLEKTGYHGIFPIPGHGGAAEMQQPRGGEQVTRYGPNAPGGGIDWPPPDGIKPVGISPFGEPETTRPQEYCAGMSENCCLGNSCDRPREDLTDREQSPDPTKICCGIMHIDLEQPADTGIKEIICAGIKDIDLGVGIPGSNLVPVNARRENWAYDERGNWISHNKKTQINNSSWGLHQRGDYERAMTYSKSDQPIEETISKHGDPYTRTFKVFHDKRGNLVDDGRQVFEYDALNRLTGVWESAKGGGQIDPETGLPYNQFEAGTKGDPVAAFTYDGYGHRLTARYNANSNGVIDDDPVDVYAYDRLWRVRTVVRATPNSSSSEATWTWYVREKWYYHDTESGQEMMTGPASTDAPIMRLIDRNGNGSFADAGEEQHFVNDHQGSTVLVTGKATLDPANGNLISRAPIIAHVKYDQYGVPKFVHPADANSDGVVDAADLTFWKQAWNEYFHGTGGGEDSPPKEVWKGVADANEDGSVDDDADPNNESLPSATNTDWVAFHALHTAGLIAEPLDQQLGNLPLYAGYWWDDAIGLYHVRHRVYRPEWGRWLQRDPLGYAPGWNLYQYVNGMPWASVDPMGLFGWGDAWDLYKFAWTAPFHKEFWIGAGEGAVILADEVTFHAIDPLHSKATQLIEENGDSHLYGSYAGKTFREVTIAAVTLGTGYIVRGGLFATGRIAQAINWASSYTKVRQAARIALFGLSGWDVQQGTTHVGQGIARIVEGDYWGALDVALGALRVFTGISGLRTASQPLSKATEVYGAPGRVYPANDGFISKARDTLKPGTRIDRYGPTSGQFASPAGSAFESRSLLDSARTLEYRVFEVVKPIPVNVGKAVPWFGQRGGGTQYQFDESIFGLRVKGYLREVPQQCQ
jgi:RHS repeat-associated protein